MQWPSTNYDVLLLSDVSSRYMYVHQFFKEHKDIWSAFMVGLYFFEKDINPPKDGVSMTQPLSAPPPLSTWLSHPLDQYRNFIRSIYVLPSECYPRTLLFVFRCILWVVVYNSKHCTHRSTGHRGSCPGHTFPQNQLRKSLELLRGMKIWRRMSRNASRSISPFFLTS